MLREKESLSKFVNAVKGENLSSASIDWIDIEAVILAHWKAGPVLAKILKYTTFLRRISSLETHLKFLILALYLSHHLINSKF